MNTRTEANDTMRIIVEPVPHHSTVAVLMPLLARIKNDPRFVEQLLFSLAQADDLAKKMLSPKLYNALPLPGMEGRWPTTVDEYLRYLVIYSRWLPQQSNNPGFEYPNSPLPNDHREVYDYLCWFYWLIDQPLHTEGTETGDGIDVLQDIPWFAEFLVEWANAWGDFLDTPESFNDKILEKWIELSPRYRIQDSMIGSPPRPNAPSGWKTFNQFFARELNPGLRPITKPADNTTIAVPADCTFNAHYAIDMEGNISPPITIKGTHTYATVQQLLHGSKYASAFNGGHFIHLFLGPYSYHRFHTPVTGMVKECYPLTGQVYLEVSLSKDGQFDAADSASDGYQFLQARGVLTVDTSDSLSGNVGVVAVLPIGMCQVSGVNMTHAEGTACDKGDEFGYFTFGGSDIIILLQKGVNPRWNQNFKPGTDYYSLYGTELATVTTVGC